jgi:hypothetical protein
MSPKRLHPHNSPTPPPTTHHGSADTIYRIAGTHPHPTATPPERRHETALAVAGTILFVALIGITLVALIWTLHVLGSALT